MLSFPDAIDRVPVMVRWEDRALGPPPQAEESSVALADVSTSDEQVWAVTPTYNAVIRLDGLAAYPNVKSVVGDRVATNQLLPQITELLAAKTDPASLRLMPNLKRLFTGFDRTDRMDLVELPETLVDLGLVACLDKPSVDNLPGLERLFIGWVEDAAHVESLERLRWLSIAPAKGLHRLGGLGNLELVRLGLDGVRPKSLAALADWANVVDVSIDDAGGLQSLRGMEGWRTLRRLSLRGAGAPTLQPLEGLPDVEEVRIQHPAVGCDLRALGALPALRRLELLGLRNLDGIFELDSIDVLRGSDRLEHVELSGTLIRDGDLAPLLDLPNLRTVVLSGDYGTQVDELREKLGPDGVRREPLQGSWGL